MGKREKCKCGEENYARAVLLSIIMHLRMAAPVQTLEKQGREERSNHWARA